VILSPTIKTPNGHYVSAQIGVSDQAAVIDFLPFQQREKYGRLQCAYIDGKTGAASTDILVLRVVETGQRISVQGGTQGFYGVISPFVTHVEIETITGNWTVYFLDFFLDNFSTWGNSGSAPAPSLFSYVDNTHVYVEGSGLQSVLNFVIPANTIKPNSVLKTYVGGAYTVNNSTSAIFNVQISVSGFNFYNGSSSGIAGGSSIPHPFYLDFVLANDDTDFNFKTSLNGRLAMGRAFTAGGGFGDISSVLTSARGFDTAILSLHAIDFTEDQILDVSVNSNESNVEFVKLTSFANVVEQ
jgi:hypothetical protein